MRQSRNRRHKRRYDVAEDMSHCVDCDRVLPVDCFYKSNDTPNNLTYLCKQCKKYENQRNLYGVDEREFLAKQDNRCGICKTDDPQSKLGWVVDHDHENDLPRGVLCRTCNIKMNIIDDCQWMASALEYKARHKLNMGV